LKSLVFVIPPDVQFGFSLAGIREQLCAPAELASTVRELMADEQIGLIVVDERLLVQVGHNSIEELHLLEKNYSGILIILPAPGKEEVVPEDYIMRLIKKAIGYQVRLDG